MNEEQMLAYANNMYPMGTVYKSSYGNNTIQGELKYYNQSLGIQITDGYGGNVYLYDTWAEVISYPEGYIPPPQINNTFPIY